MDTSLSASTVARLPNRHRLERQAHAIVLTADQLHRAHRAFAKELEHDIVFHARIGSWRLGRCREQFTGVLSSGASTPSRKEQSLLMMQRSRNHDCFTFAQGICAEDAS